MSWYSLQQALIFIHIPKNAGSSINALLQGAVGDYNGFEALNASYGYERDMVFGNHFTYQMIASFVNKNNVDLDYRKFFKFCVIRNPWERMVSLYDHRIRKMHATFEGKPRNAPEDIALLEQGFKAWLLTTQHTSDRVLTKLPQVEWIKDVDGAFVPDLIVPFENVQGGIDKVMDHLSVPRIQLPYVNTNENDTSRYVERYDDETRDFIAHHFADDIRIFNYRFGD